MNVLLTCAGRRNYLIRYFKDALGGEGRVLTADASEHAPALHESDGGFVLPPVHAHHYVDALAELCRKENVGLLISLNDHELPVLARHKQRLAGQGTVAVVSDPEVIDICFDKWKTCRFLERIGLSAPRTWLDLHSVRADLEKGACAFPLVVKPRWGSGSAGIESVWDDLELEAVFLLISRRLGRGSDHASLGREPMEASGSTEHPAPRVLIQECLAGAEHGLDIVNDLHGAHRATFVKRKLAMRAGETDRAMVVESPRLVALGRTIGEHLRHVGNLDCDVFVDGDDVRVLELNPRFGGGYPFSHEAGANVPRALLAWVAHREPSVPWDSLTAGKGWGKCDRLVSLGRSATLLEGDGR